MAMPPQPWPTGEIEQLEPLVRRVLAPNGSPFTYTGTQTYLVGGDKGLAVIDPGPAVPEHLEALVRAIGGARVAAGAVAGRHRPGPGSVAVAGSPVAGARRSSRMVQASAFSGW